jgi:arginyl-tRNA synthetase
MATLTSDGIEAVLANLAGERLPALAGELASLQVQHRPLDVYRAHLIDFLLKHTACDIQILYDSIQTSNTLSHGDLVVPVPRLRLKGKKPDEVAADIASSFPKHHALFRDLVAGGIHVSVFFSARSLSHLLVPYIFDRGSAFGHVPSLGVQSGHKQKLIVEFSSLNIAKEFHAGHLRSTIIGAFLANLHESMGWEVMRINYLGDWGKQFGLLAAGWKRFGSEEALGREPLKHLLDVYARINSQFQPEEDARDAARAEGRDTAELESRGLFAERNAFFARMENGDEEALALWRRFRQLSVERYAQTYARLNIGFDEYEGESQVQATTIEYVEQRLRDNGVYYEEDGSWMINYDKHGSQKGMGVAVLRGRTGTTTYLLRDVAALLERERKYGFDRMMYVVSTEQDLHFRRVFRTVELLGRPDLAARLKHVNFGKVMGMSSRLGNVQLLSDILDRAADAMHGVMRQNEAKYAQMADPEAAAEAVGIAAVMAQDMSGKRINNYPFDMARMTSFEGDTGPYLQYCHARLHSILRKARLSHDDLASHVAHSPEALDADAEGKQHCADLLRLMAQYPEVTTTALRTLEPSTILTYLFRLAHQVSSCYDVLQVIGPHARETMLARASLYEAARQVLENGMKLLGFTPVERYVGA